ncbi:hypothetical protein BDV26DRAFT_187624 [Aspergillus bertholletiae]|uniref:MFS maltose permease n=1 Tax=Aspergillus bertholletiae TaxID=1226010 RepID=A0A5N7B9Y6_9EURO|nr:hypothetical protein BDV26DRAFT_187624 [Aspergillus bertholletiae]
MLPPARLPRRLPGGPAGIRACPTPRYKQSPSTQQQLQQNTSHRRAFTQKTRLDLITAPYTRPQLPFLSPLASSRPVPPLSIHLRQHFARLISTESREHYKRRLGRGLRIGLSFYAMLVLFQVIKLGVYQEEIEHRWPTPPEWSWKSRWCLRSAQALQHPEDIGKLMTNWPMVAGYVKELLERLEDVTREEGRGIVKQDDGGFDVSGKSEPWRRGYFQALMGGAKAAENLEGWLTDRKQRISAPAEYVVGPSNPRPKPMPAGQKKVPREEDCEQASPSPEVFYMKILNTRGFDTRQKLDAALAYADWLDYKGLQDNARDMYNRAMDIAASGSLVDAGKVVDVKTGILKNDGKDLPSENILRVSTALAVNHARHGNLPTALSIFTSVLKARRSLPPPPSGMITMPKLPSLHKTNDPFRYIFDSIKIMLVPVEYPAPLPSGNEPPLRTATSACEEAGLMTYIGEIIYASSSKEQGLAWTRDAVDTAEATMLELGESEDHIPRHRCAECLRVGLENWKTMVSRLVTKAKKEEQESIQKSGGSWFGGGQKQIEAKSVERKRWEAENLILDDRIRRLWPKIDGETGLDGIAPNSSLFV